MIYLDLALRGAAITVLLLLAALMWRVPINREGRLSMAAVAVTESAHLLIATALPIPFPPVILANLQLVASLAPLALTWLILTIFLDAPRLRWPWMLAAAIASAALFAHLAFAADPVICATTAGLLYSALLALAVWSSRDDLVECRCRARPGFALVVAGIGVFLTMGEASGLFETGGATLALVRSAGTLAVAVAFAFWLLQPNVNLWPGDTGAPRPLQGPNNADTPIDPSLVARMREAMAAGIWREEGLTIGALANKLNVPEHRLRRAINQGLGHRNFSSFINHARIEAARDMLVDPGHAHTTVLEIAYEVGFASVGPFNRAFRAETGQSPTEYRRIGQADIPADSEKTAPIGPNLH